jgi:hypothetical protein
MKSTKIKITSKDINDVVNGCSEYVNDTRNILCAKEAIQRKKQSWLKLPDDIKLYEKWSLEMDALSDHWAERAIEIEKIIALGEDAYIAETVKESEDIIKKVSINRMDHAITYLKSMQELAVKIGYEPCEINPLDSDTETIHSTPIKPCGKKPEEIYNQAIQIRDAKKIEKQNGRDALSEIKIELVKTDENRWMLVSKDFVLATKILNVPGDQIYFHTKEISGGIFIRSIKDWLQITDGKAEIEITKDGVIVREVNSTSKIFLKWQPYVKNKNSKIVPFVLSEN